MVYYWIWSPYAAPQTGRNRLVAVSPETGFAWSFNSIKLSCPFKNYPGFLRYKMRLLYLAIYIVSRDTLALRRVKMVKDVCSAVKKDKYTSAFFALYYYLF